MMIRFVAGIGAMAVSALWAVSSLDGVAGIVTAVLVGVAGLIVAITGLVKVLHEVRASEATKAAALVSAAAAAAAALVSADDTKAAALIDAAAKVEGS